MSAVAVFRRLNETLDRIDSTIDRNTRAFEDLQLVIRESRIREERALTHFEEALDAWTSRVSAQLEANTAQVRAQTAAIWRMLDRWGEGPTPAS